MKLLFVEFCPQKRIPRFELSRDDNPFKRGHICERDGTFLFLVTRCTHPYTRRSHKSRRAQDSGALAANASYYQATHPLQLRKWARARARRAKCLLSLSPGTGRRLESHGTPRRHRVPREKRFAGDTEIGALRARSRTIHGFSPCARRYTRCSPANGAETYLRDEFSNCLASELVKFFRLTTLYSKYQLRQPLWFKGNINDPTRRATTHAHLPIYFAIGKFIKTRWHFLFYFVRIGARVTGGR